MSEKDEKWLVDPKHINHSNAEAVIAGISHAVLGDRDYHDFRREEFENPFIFALAPEKRKSPRKINGIAKLFGILSLTSLLTGFATFNIINFLLKIRVVLNPIELIMMFLFLAFIISSIVTVVCSRG